MILALDRNGSVPSSRHYRTESMIKMLRTHNGFDQFQHFSRMTCFILIYWSHHNCHSIFSASVFIRVFSFLLINFVEQSNLNGDYGKNSWVETGHYRFGIHIYKCRIVNARKHAYERNGVVFSEASTNRKVSVSRVVVCLHDGNGILQNENTLEMK